MFLIEPRGARLTHRSRRLRTGSQRSDRWKDASLDVAGEGAHEDTGVRSVVRVRVGDHALSGSAVHPLFWNVTVWFLRERCSKNAVPPPPPL